MNFKATTLQKEKRWLRWMRIGKLFGCHQMCERSFFYKQYQFPLCARCTGVVVGEFVFAPIVFFSLGFSWWSLVLLGPLIIDGSLQYKTAYVSNNIKRFISGILAGTGLGLLVLFIILEWIF